MMNTNITVVFNLSLEAKMGDVTLSSHHIMRKLDEGMWLLLTLHILNIDTSYNINMFPT